MKKIIVMMSVTLILNVTEVVKGEDLFVPDQIIVTYKDYASQEDKLKLESKFSLKVIKKFRLTNSIFYKFESKINASVLKKSISKSRIVKLVTLNKNLINYSYDPELNKQWYLENTGQSIQFSSGTKGVDIGWKQAIEEIYNPKGSSFVAVLDSGFAKDHDEIKTRNAINSEEKEGEIGNDDDQNGYIDDIYGWDFFSDDSDPYDFDGHGTQISSIIASAKDGVGIQGIAPYTYVYPLRIAGKWLDGETRPTVAAVVEALEYIYFKPSVRVVNLSIGLRESQLLRDTIDVFDNNDRVLLVCAAGNENEDNDKTTNLPSTSLSNCIISVASINNKGKLSWFSNYGEESVDLAAPGENLYAASVKYEVKKHYPIKQYSWVQSFQWTNEGNSWNLGERYQEYWFSKSPTLTSPFSLFGLYTELKNQGDPINLKGTILPRLKIRLSYNIDSTSIAGLFASTSNAIDGYKKIYEFNGITFDFNQVEVPLDQLNFTDKLYLKFVFVNVNQPLDFLSVGTITLEDIDVENYLGKPYYKYVSGTSYSAPVVASVASLIFSHRPDLLASDVKKILIDSVKPLEDLEGKVLSGGIVKADEALKLANTFRKRVHVDIEPTTVPAYGINLNYLDDGEITSTSDLGKSMVGKVEGGGWYFEGDNVTIKATEYPGWKFSTWANVKNKMDQVQTITVNEDLKILAIYEPDMSDDDNDTLKHYYEIILGTDPLKYDTDGDSLSDGDEYLSALVASKLDPKINNISDISSLESVFGKTSFGKGINSVLNAPLDYSLITQAEHLRALDEVNASAEKLIAESKAISKANGIEEGKLLGKLEGESSVTSNPSAYNLVTQEAYDQMMNDLMSASDSNATHYTEGWFYLPSRGWMWTNREAYPYFYDSEDNDWMYFQSGEEKPKFYRYKTKAWLTIE